MATHRRLPFPGPECLNHTPLQVDRSTLLSQQNLVAALLAARQLAERHLAQPLSADKWHATAQLESRKYNLRAAEVQFTQERALLNRMFVAMTEENDQV